jgi:hypothetical protein
MNLTMYSYTVPGSVHFFESLYSERLSELFNVHICATDHELKHSANINFLLALFLEFERNFVLCYDLGGFGAQALAHLFKFLHVDLTWVSEKADYEVGSQENDSLLLVLKLFCELG